MRLRDSVAVDSGLIVCLAIFFLSGRLRANDRVTTLCYYDWIYIIRYIYKLSLMGCNRRRAEPVARDIIFNICLNEEKFVLFYIYNLAVH